MRIAVIKQTIALTKDETLIEQSDEIYSIHFDFDETWDGFDKTAFFQAGDYETEVALVDDECDIPSECLEIPGIMLKVLICGVKNGEEISTPWCNISRILYNTSIDIPIPSIPPIPPEPSDDEYSRLSNDFEAILRDEFTEEELEGKELPEVVNEIEELVGNTATNEEVEEILDDVWGDD